MEIIQAAVFFTFGMYVCLTLKGIREDIGEFHDAACTRLEEIKNATVASLEESLRKDD